MSKYLKIRVYQIVIPKAKIDSKKVKIKNNWICQHQKVLG